EAFSPCSTALDGRGARDARKSRTHALSDEERLRPQCTRRFLTPSEPWLLAGQVLSRLAGGTCYEADFLAFAENAQPCVSYLVEQRCRGELPARPGKGSATLPILKPLLDSAGGPRRALPRLGKRSRPQPRHRRGEQLACLQCVCQAMAFEPAADIGDRHR